MQRNGLVVNVEISFLKRRLVCSRLQVERNVSRNARWHSTVQNQTSYRLFRQCSCQNYFYSHFNLETKKIYCERFLLIVTINLQKSFEKSKTCKGILRWLFIMVSRNSGKRFETIVLLFLSRKAFCYLSSGCNFSSSTFEYNHFAFSNADGNSYSDFESPLRGFVNQFLQPTKEDLWPRKYGFFGQHCD